MRVCSEGHIGVSMLADTWISITDTNIVSLFDFTPQVFFPFRQGSWSRSKNDWFLSVRIVGRQ